MTQTFSRDDLADAVHAGVVEQGTADKLATFLFNRNSNSLRLADEEQFRLVTSFNDIFVTIGIALFLGALFYLSKSVLPFAGSNGEISTGFSAGVVGFAAWCLAEIFTLRRRMALPSIVLLATFVVLAGLAAGYFIKPVTDSGNYIVPIAAFVVSGIAAMMHWFRFHVPITIAAGVGAVSGLFVSLIGSYDKSLLADWPLLTVFPIGLLVFATAMYFDSSDRLRVTQRTDIAFWLHMLAAPLIVHPIVYPLTMGQSLTSSGAVAVILLFLALSVVALVIDRRALLVSSLTYLGYAAYKVISLFELASEGTAVAILLVGAIVLLLSIGWHWMRRMMLSIAPRQLLTIVPPVSS